MLRTVASRDVVGSFRQAAALVLPAQKAVLKTQAVPGGSSSV